MKIKKLIPLSLIFTLALTICGLPIASAKETIIEKEILSLENDD